MSSPFLELRWLGLLVARFAVGYAVLMFASVRLPLFEFAEKATVALVDAGFWLSATPAASRSIELVDDEGLTSYRFEVRNGQESREIRRAYHPHTYIAALFIAVVLGTPSLDRGQRLRSLAAGTSLLLLFAAGLLASDLALWQSEAERVSPPSAWSPLGLLGGLHRTAAAGLVPVLMWVIVAAEIVRRERAVDVPPSDP